LLGIHYPPRSGCSMLALAGNAELELVVMESPGLPKVRDRVEALVAGVEQDTQEVSSGDCCSYTGLDFLGFFLSSFHFPLGCLLTLRLWWNLNHNAVST